MLKSNSVGNRSNEVTDIDLFLQFARLFVFETWNREK